MHMLAALSDDLRKKATEIRRKILNISYLGRTPHIGSCLSCVDVLTAVYWGGLNISPENATHPDRDRLVFGKGHAAAALLAALWKRGFFPTEVLTEFNRPGGPLQEHPGPNWPAGVEIAAGSLGHALPIAVGLALAARVLKVQYRVCAVIGDGECNEGSIWEAAMFAGSSGLGNLCVVIDANGWQGIGRSGEITALEPLVDKWRAFGWYTMELDGHDPVQLRNSLAAFGADRRPTAIIARTIKGKGISFMEDDNNWHYRLLSDDDMKKAMSELDD